MTKKIAIIVVLVAGLAVLYYYSPAQVNARLVKDLVEHNIETRGGIEQWKNVKALKLSGQMDVGQGVHLPYVLEQKRPNKMCLKFEFDKQTTVQCSTGKTGWKSVPFRGRAAPELMTAKELRESADSADLYGLLYHYNERGIVIEAQGKVKFNGKEVYKLKITLPRGAVRWLYLDAKTALEVKLESQRMVRGKERLVETVYKDWQDTQGLLISHRQETRTSGDTESHYLTVDKVVLNPEFDDAMFEMPDKNDNKQVKL